MKRFASVFIMLIAVQAHGAEPAAAVPFPELGAPWKVQQYADSKASGPWQTRVLVNSETGDLLSFAARAVAGREPKSLVKWSDTAREIFPAGHPAWTPSSPAATSNTQRNRIVKVGSGSMLEYTLVVEAAEGENRMVQGYVHLADRLVVIVQHTSRRPITSELARKTAKSVCKAIAAR